MDLYCPTCGEPWDMDSLNDVPGVTFATASRRFGEEGCALFETRHNDVVDEDRAARSGILFDLLGDDIDGIASEMTD